MSEPHADYAARQAAMDAEYVAAGGGAPNHQRQFPQVFRGNPVDDMADPEVYRADDAPEPVALSQDGSAVKRLIEFMESLTKEKCYVHKLAFMRIVGRDNRSFAELAKIAGTSKATFLREYWRVDRFLRGGEGGK